MEKSFEAIQIMLTHELSLTNFNPDLKIIVATDANVYGIRVVICQRFKDVELNDIARMLIAVEIKLQSNRKINLLLLSEDFSQNDKC